MSPLNRNTHLGHVAGQPGIGRKFRAENDNFCDSLPAYRSPHRLVVLYDLSHSPPEPRRHGRRSAILALSTSLTTNGNKHVDLNWLLVFMEVTEVLTMLMTV